jgi:predicted molibdopterin-dependent oxidoreductase YjgC
MTTHPLLTRIEGATGPRRPISFTLDGRSCTALEGDTVLGAVLLQQAQVRLHEVSGRPHAGFCAMGACQDCWMDTETGERLRACTTPLAEGLRLLSRRVP